MSGKGASKESQGMYGFDPTGLERAAKAAKVLDHSPNSKLAFELANKEEETKQMQMKINLKKLEYENKRSNMSYEAQIAKERAEYEDYLAKERIAYKLQMEKQMKEDALRETEESIKRQEEYRKATIKFESDLIIQREREKLVQQFELQSSNERDNFDIVEKKIRIKEQERRITAGEIARTSLDLIGRGVKDFLQDRHLFTRVVTGVTAAYVFAYGCKGLFNLTYKIIGKRILTPKLVKETSRLNYSQFYKLPYRVIEPYFLKVYGKLVKNSYNKRQLRMFDSMYFSQHLEDNLRLISNSVLNKKQHNTPFRNLLFYGPPGNGKTLFAKALAYNSGIDYAIMTGADVLPLGTDAVVELDKIFDWAESSSNGLLLFIDESDAFLKRRQNDEVLSENLRSVINSFLYRTGTPTNKFFVVLATNAPQLLDEAVQDRIDDMVYFSKPSELERLKILKFYLEKYVISSNSDPKYFYEKIQKTIRDLFKQQKPRVQIDFTDEDVLYLAEQCKDFSSREIVKLVVLIHDLAHMSQGMPRVNLNTFKSACSKFSNQKELKSTWNKSQTDYFNKVHH